MRRECCIDCGDDFRYDDCGGYNPPCVCGFHCQRCHETEAREIADDQEDGGWMTHKDDSDDLWDNSDPEPKP